MQTVKCSMPQRRMVLPGDATSAWAARRFLEEASCPEHMATVLEDAQLLVSELVGNAVRHGLPPIEVTVECVGEKCLEVRVRDTSLATPAVRRAGVEAEDGRGLQLVDLLSSEWGTKTDSFGKTVWFHLDV